jgi:hypothetical protein
MRILGIRRPTISEVDGLDLRRFKVGQQYEVGTRVGSYMVAERWADFVDASGRRFTRGPDRRNRVDRRRTKGHDKTERRHTHDRRHSDCRRSS